MVPGWQKDSAAPADGVGAQLCVVWYDQNVGHLFRSLKLNMQKKRYVLCGFEGCAE